MCADSTVIYTLLEALKDGFTEGDVTLMWRVSILRKLPDRILGMIFFFQSNPWTGSQFQKKAV